MKPNFLAITQSFWDAYAGDRVATNMLHKEIKKLVTQDKQVFKRFTQMLGIVETEELLGLRNIAPLSEDEKEIITNLVEATANAKGEVK